MPSEEFFDPMSLLSYFSAIIKLLALQKGLQIFVNDIIVNMEERFYEVFLKAILSIKNQKQTYNLKASTFERVKALNHFNLL
jgi:hypothetical protein